MTIEVKNKDIDAVEMRKMEISYKYGDSAFPADGIPVRKHIILYAIALFMVVFFVWTNIAKLEEVTRGEGRVIPSSKVQTIQNLEGGIIDEFLVKNGDKVEKDQILIRIHNTQAKSDFEAMNQKYYALLAALIRLQAEAEGKTPVFTEEIIEKSVDIVKTEQRSFEANKKQYAGQISILNEQLTQKQQEVSELEKRIKDSSLVVKLANEEKDMIAPLVKQGYAPKIELLKMNQNLAQQEADLNSLKTSLPRLKASVREVENRLYSFKNDFLANIQKEISLRTAEINTVKETLSAYKDRNERTEIRSPVYGIVKDMKITTVGGIAKSGETIMEIVPLGDKLIVETNVRPSDIAFIHQGQKAIIRLSAFDFSIYGSITGEVSDISPDSIINERGESFYRVRVITDKTKISRNNKEFAIMPGMQATVDIVTGEKTIMNYILKPFMKASQTALRER